MNQDELRKIPGVDQLLETVEFPPDFPGPLKRRLIRRRLDDVRESIRNGGECPPEEELRNNLSRSARRLTANRVQPVVNATGVVLHTNLGRAPYGSGVLEDMGEVLEGYCSLEMDLSTGDRGGRGAFGEELLCQLTGADAAAIVNNCSAALVLVLKTLATNRDVLISRGELVQIGGGFRIPEILEASGASLREVGTTNRTDLDDYRSSLDRDVALLLKVHRSNFDLVGFTESAPVSDLADLAGDRGVPLVCDLGSGALWDTTQANLRPEPRPSEMIEAGADLVVFSGDKLLGGPQAGLILGREDLVESLQSNPFFRALRCGKATLTALESTLVQYARNEGRDLPARQLLSTPAGDLRERAESVLRDLGSPESVTVAPMDGTVGGGSLPGETMPGHGLVIRTSDPGSTLEELRRGDPPVVGRVLDDDVCLNFRSVLPRQDEALRSRVSALL